jgi:hypothetical protein
VADLQAHIPEQREERLQCLLQFLRFAVEEDEQVDIRSRVQLAAAVAAHGDQGHPLVGQVLRLPGAAQQGVDHCRALTHEVPGAAPAAKILVEARVGLAQGLAQGDEQSRLVAARGDTLRVEELRCPQCVHA